MKHPPPSGDLQVTTYYMHEEDHDELLALGGTCVNKKHPGYRKPRSECSNPECIVWTVLSR